jgi:hypothetical protein
VRRLFLGFVAIAFAAGAACANGLISDDGGVDSSLSDSSSDAPSKDAGQDVVKPTSDGGCPGTLTPCGQACVDLKTDPNHCGGCNTVCSTADAGNPGDAGTITAVCTAGQCGINCGGNLTQCGETCVDEKNDPLNCGGCGTSCDGGACCTGQCVDTTSDNGNCGACGKACDGGTVCVANVCSVSAPYDVGYYTPFSTTGSFTLDYLLGEKITLTKAATLLDFGIIDATTGQHVVMALYTDKNGAPDQLVAYTSSTALTGSDQKIAANTQASLAATSYWIMAVYDQTAGPLRDNSTTNQIDYISFTFGGTLPTTFPTPTTYTGQIFNYYLVVQ